MTKLYKAANPADIAAEFRRMGQLAFDTSLRKTLTKREQAHASAEFVIWNQAANMIDNTEFVDWSHDGMTADEIKNSNTPEAQKAARRLMQPNDPTCECGYSLENCMYPICPVGTR